MREEIEKLSLDLCYAIEKLPSSDQQTKVSILASALSNILSKQPPSGIGKHEMKQVVEALRYLAYERNPIGEKIIDSIDESCQMKVIEAIKVGEESLVIYPSQPPRIEMDREQFGKELFNSLGGCIIKETTGETIYDVWFNRFSHPQVLDEKESLCGTKVYNKLWDMTEALELNFHRCKSNQESRDVRNNFINRFCEWLNTFSPTRVPVCDRCKCDLSNFRLCPNCMPKDIPELEEIVKVCHKNSGSGRGFNSEWESMSKNDKSVFIREAEAIRELIKENND